MIALRGRRPDSSKAFSATSFVHEVAWRISRLERSTSLRFTGHEIHHQILVHLSEADHGRGGDHVQDELLRCSGLHARGARDHFGADVEENDMLCMLKSQGTAVAAHRRHDGAAVAGPCHGAKDVRGLAGRRDADEYVSRTESGGPQVPYPGLAIVLRALDGTDECGAPSRDDALHHRGGDADMSEGIPRRPGRRVGPRFPRLCRRVDPLCETRPRRRRRARQWGQAHAPPRRAPSCLPR